MQERQIRVTTAAATLLWTLGLTLVVAGIFTGRHGLPGLGVLTGLAASVMQVRGYLADHEECIREALAAGRRHAERQAVKSLR